MDSKGTANAKDRDGGLTARIVPLGQVYPREDANGRNVTTDRLYITVIDINPICVSKNIEKCPMKRLVLFIGHDVLTL